MAHTEHKNSAPSRFAKRFTWVGRAGYGTYTMYMGPMLGGLAVTHRSGTQWEVSAPRINVACHVYAASLEEAKPAAIAAALFALKTMYEDAGSAIEHLRAK